MKSWLFNNSAIITGASSGIGREIARIMIFKYNCKVLGVGRHREKLEAFKKELGDKAENFEIFAMDVSKLENWKKLKDFACGRYKIVINNAGTMHPFMCFDKIEIETAKRIFETNFFSCIYAYKTFFKEFQNKKDTGIVNISSASALCSIPGESIYSASKSAQCSFSKIVSCENKKILFVATYLPGFTRTNLFLTTDNKKPIIDKKNMKLLNKICMPVSKMAKKIVRAISHKKRFKKFGKDAFMLKFFDKLFPCKSSDFYKWLFKVSKLECFKDIFE